MLNITKVLSCWMRLRYSKVPPQANADYPKPAHTVKLLSSVRLTKYNEAPLCTQTPLSTQVQ